MCDVMSRCVDVNKNYPTDELYKRCNGENSNCLINFIGLNYSCATFLIELSRLRRLRRKKLIKHFSNIPKATRTQIVAFESFQLPPSKANWHAIKIRNVQLHRIYVQQSAGRRRNNLIYFHHT